MYGNLKSEKRLEGNIEHAIPFIGPRWQEPFQFQWRPGRTATILRFAPCFATGHAKNWKLEHMNFKSSEIECCSRSFFWNHCARICRLPLVQQTEPIELWTNVEGFAPISAVGRSAEGCWVESCLVRLAPCRTGQLNPIDTFSLGPPSRLRLGRAVLCGSKGASNSWAIDQKGAAGWLVFLMNSKTRVFHNHVPSKWIIYELINQILSRCWII